MSEERRYQEDEVAEIFEAAVAPRRPGEPARSSPEGLTLAELQEIGREVGVAPERIAEAASALDRRPGALARRTYLGMPVAVGRTVDLPRAPTDREWALLVTELRETFGAQGTDRSRGDLRQWTNGNLHATVEPTETGERLRLGTRKGNAATLTWMGTAWLLTALVMLVAMLLSGDEAAKLVLPAMFGALGAGSLASNAVRLPRWAREREEQMEHIAARARALIGAAREPVGTPEGDG